MANAPIAPRPFAAFWTKARARLGLDGPGQWILVLAAALVLAGLVMRVGAPAWMDLWMDGATYAAMGHAFLQEGDFILPWGDVSGSACIGPAPSHHYPPLYPMLLAGTYAAFGFGLAQTQWTAVAVAVAALAVVWWCTKDLFGKASAWLVAGILAVERGLVVATGTGFTENLVLLLFTVTLWAILKGLHDGRFMVVAGAAAGLAYLTRAGMGAFFVIAGLAGLAWRFHYMRWAVFRDRWYLAGAALFALLVAAWAARNLAHFGWPNWETSAYTTFVQGYAADNPGRFLAALGTKLPLFLLFLALYLAPFAVEAWRSLRNVRKEEESALWLAVVLVVGIGWVLSSLYWTHEQWGTLFGIEGWWLDNHRYVLIAYVPLLWMVARHRDLASRSFRVRYVAFGLAMLSLSALAVAQPTQNPYDEAAADLAPRLRPGDEVGIHGSGENLRYALYPHLQDHRIAVYGCVPNEGQACGSNQPDHILSNDATVPRGYRLVETHAVDYLYGDDGEGPSTWTVYTYERTGPGPQGPRAPGCVP